MLDIEGEFFLANDLFVNTFVDLFQQKLVPLTQLLEIEILGCTGTRCIGDQYFVIVSAKA